MTDRELDQLLKQVLLDAVKLDMEEIAETDALFGPSVRYQRQMAAMQRDPLKWMRKKTRSFWKHILRQAAMVLLVLSIGFGCLMAAVPSARAAVVQWFIEWYDTYLVYRYGGELSADELPEYALTWIPEGYQESRKEKNTSSAILVYENNEGGAIFFGYWLTHSGAADVIRTEDSEIVDIKVNNYDGLFFKAIDSEQMNTMTWVDSKAGIQFQINANEDKNVILHIAEGANLDKFNK